MTVVIGMITFVIIGIIVVRIIYVIYLTISGGSTTNTKGYTPTVYTKPSKRIKDEKLSAFYRELTQVNSPSQTISVSPTKISSNPNLKISLIDGEYRYFENHYVNGKQYSFGFPKDNCPDKRVWIGIGKKEIERISYSEAKKRIGNKDYIPSQTKSIG